MSAHNKPPTGTRVHWVIGALFAGGLALAFSAGRLWPEGYSPAGDLEHPQAAEPNASDVVPIRVRYLPSAPQNDHEDAAFANDTGAEREPAAEPNPEPPPNKQVTFAELQGEVQTELRDATWAREVEGRLEEGLREARESGAFKGEVQVLRADCGSRRCAVDAVAQNSRDVSALGESITRSLRLKRGRTYRARLPEGGSSVSVVAARDGFDLFGNERVVASVSSNPP